MKKFTSLLAILLVLAALLTACGGNGAEGGKDNADQQDSADGGSDAVQDREDGEEALPELELPDISGVTLSQLETTDAGFSYPAEKWTPGEEGTLYLNSTLDADAKVNVSVTYQAEMNGLTDGDLEEMKSAMLSEELSFMEAKSAEFKMAGDTKVMVLDIAIVDKDAYIDHLIEFVGLDEETLEAAGGRDGILALMPPSSHLMYYFIRDGHLYSVSSIYFNDSQKADITELFAAVLSTVEKA